MALITQMTSHQTIPSAAGCSKPKTKIVPMHSRAAPVKNEQPNNTAEEAACPKALPVSLETIPKAHHFPNQRHRWNTNEEIAAILICFEKHEVWLSKEVKIRPKSGSMLLYSRKRVRYRRDGYCWKKRKDGKTTREDHMKLKVQGTECIYGCYVHSAILPTFHRRCYWLLQNPDVVLVHYLNVPYGDDSKMLASPSLTPASDGKKEWTKEELVSQLKPMFYSENRPDLNNEVEIEMAETVEAIVQQLMDKQRSGSDAPVKPVAAAAKSLHCVISPKAQQPPVILARPAEPLILNLSQLQGAGSLLILNGGSRMGTGPLTLICNQKLNGIKTEPPPPQPVPDQLASLTPEDLQKTLAATSLLSPDDNKADHSMDFMDDPFNLDQFDMFSDLDDLCLPPGPSLYPDSPPRETASPPPHPSLIAILDYSPEWSYTEGGVKVLVIGPWKNPDAAGYSVLFDGQATPTVLVQSGVLRCQCPAHDAGVVTVQVVNGGFVVSNTVTFEYRSRGDEWFAMDESALKFLLLERLDWLESKMRPVGGRGEVSPGTDFEERAVATCERLMGGAWIDDGAAGSGGARPDLTLLHLAAALGGPRLLGALLRWRSEAPGLPLEAQVDALRRDRRECTPLAWAVARGHREAAALLFRWNRAAANIPDCLGRTPAQLASDPDIATLLARRLTKRSSDQLFPGLEPAPGGGESGESRVLTLAEQIIAAMPDRIKASAQPSVEESFSNFDFELSDHNYRYCEVSTPASSLSPASCLQSPGLAPLDSPPPTTADFSEFLQAGGNQGMVEKEFSNLTLSDTEQRELYEAAKIIQKAYRSYKGRKEEQEKERGAAVLIQSYYRRYKQYLYFQQMSRAAQVIQTQFRSYCEHKRFKKSKESTYSSSGPFYRGSGLEGPSDSRGSREGTPTSTGLKRTYSQRRQHQAARKIQQFMRQSKNNDWDMMPGNAIAERTCLSGRKRGGDIRPTLSGPF